MTGTPGIPLFPPQPAKGTVGERFCLLLLTLQQLRQGGGQLLGRPSIGVSLPAVPVTLPKPQLLMQPAGIRLNFVGPEGHGRDPRQYPS
jgi:hypothetical protein